jgi:hypothetical protein
MDVKVHVFIDQLVLDGVSRGEQHVVVDAMRADLHRLLASSRSAVEFGATREIERLSAPAQPGPALRTPAQIGSAIAERILNGVRA